MTKVSKLSYDEYLNILYGMMEYKDNQPYFPVEVRWDWCKKAEENDGVHLRLKYEINFKDNLVQVDLSIFDGDGDNEKVWQKASCQSYVEQNLASNTTYDSRNYSLRNAYLGALDTCLALRGYTVSFLLAELRYAGILQKAASPDYSYPVASQEKITGGENISEIEPGVKDTTAPQRNEAQTGVNTSESAPSPVNIVTVPMGNEAEAGKSPMENIIEAALSNTDFGEVPDNDGISPDPSKAVIPSMQEMIPEDGNSPAKDEKIANTDVPTEKVPEQSNSQPSNGSDENTVTTLSSKILSYKIQGQCSYKGLTIRKILKTEPERSVMIYLKWVAKKGDLPEYKEDAEYCKAVYEYLSKK